MSSSTIKQSHYIAGSVTAGCFSTLLGHPLDTIKVYQQTHQSSKYHDNIIAIAKKLAKGEHYIRLFRGIGPPMANQIVMNSVMFTVFNNVKDTANQCTVLNENTSSLLAGLFSGFATACISTPSDWYKIQAQITLSDDASSSYVKKKKKFGRNGVSFVRTIYRGHIANLCREGVFTMVYLGMYDRISNEVKARRRNIEPNSTAQNDTGNLLGMIDIVLISSFTGACAWICNYPFDTIKTIIQADTSKHITIRDSIRTIYNSGGLKAFWRGVGSSTLRACLVTSSRMLAYEKTIQLLNNQ